MNKSAQLTCASFALESWRRPGGSDTSAWHQPHTSSELRDMTCNSGHTVPTLLRDETFTMCRWKKSDI
jgi:hypothetical protein